MRQHRDDKMVMMAPAFSYIRRQYDMSGPQKSRHTLVRAAITAIRPRDGQGAGRRIRGADY